MSKGEGGLKLSTDEGSFITRTLVAICLLLVFTKYQQGQIMYHNLHLLVKTKALICTSTRFDTRSGRIFDNQFWIYQNSLNSIFKPKNCNNVFNSLRNI